MALKPAEKICSKCKKVKPVTDFSYRKKTQKHISQCKKCFVEYYIKPRYRSDAEYRRKVKEGAIKSQSKQTREYRNEIRRRALLNYRNIHRKQYNESCRATYFLTVSGLRVKVLERGKCADCERKVGITPRDYAIHHRNKDVSDNRLENLLLLCVSCHFVHHRLESSKENQLPIINSRVSD
ncbi:MAG: HNH endonuclease signature motif containing protein [Candidatus Bathyarchaeota archaeon]